MKKQPTTHFPAYVQYQATSYTNFAAYCFDDPTPLPTDSVLNFTSEAHVVNIHAVAICPDGFEYTDAASGTNDTLLKERRWQCREINHPQGGVWVNIDVIPEACYSKYCIH